MMKAAFPVAESSKTVTPSPISTSELNADMLQGMCAEL